MLFLWVRDRETLLSAVIAICAAGLGAYYLHRQIEVTQNLERKRSKRRLRAARATFALTLSSVCDYAISLTKEWLRLRNDLAARRRPSTLNPITAPRTVDFPKLAPTIISELSAIVEASSKTQAAPVIEMLNEMQVRISRSRGAAADFLGDDARGYTAHYINDEIVEAAELYARASDLFDFARGEGPPPPAGKPSGKSVRRALWLMQIYDAAEPDIYAVAARRFPTPPDPAADSAEEDPPVSG